MSLNERLIELVRDLPVLYDTNHEDYSKKTYKDSLWANIAKDLNLQSGTEAKNIWLKLRSCHREAIRRKSTKSGSAAMKTKPWKYEPQMNFLINYMANRNTSGNINLAQEDVEVTVQTADLFDDSHNPDNVHDYIEPDNDETAENDAADIIVKPTAKFCTKKNVNEMFIKTLKQHQERAVARQANKNNNKKDDGLYHFFMSMYDSVAKMPTTNQVKLKRKLFNIVSEEEETLCHISSINRRSSSETLRSSDCSDSNETLSLAISKSSVPGRPLTLNSSHTQLLPSPEVSAMSESILLINDENAASESQQMTIIDLNEYIRFGENI